MPTPTPTGSTLKTICPHPLPYLGKWINSFLIPSLSINDSEHMIDILYILFIARLTELTYRSPCNRY